MATIVVVLLALFAVVAWVVVRSMDRNSTILFLAGPPFCALVGPLVWVLPAIPMMLYSEKGFTAGAFWGFGVFVVGTIPAFVAGIFYSAAILYFRDTLARSQRHALLYGAAFGALVGGIATAVLTFNAGAAVLGGVSGAVCGAAFPRVMFNRLARNGVA